MKWSGVVALLLIGCVVLVVGAGGISTAAAGPSQSADAHDFETIPDPVESAPPLIVTGFEGPAAADLGTDAEATPPPFADLADEEFDSTEFRIRVEADGDAVWRFEFRRVLETEDDREQFDEFATTFRETETEFYQSFEQQAFDLIAAGEAVTDRQMEARSFDRSAERREQLGNEFGIVEIRFRWTNFAQTADDGTVTMGDVFQGSMFISEDQRLVVEAGDGLVFEEVQPEGVTSASTLRESSTVTWEGDREFLDGRPRAVFVPTGGPTETTGGTNVVSPFWAAFALVAVALVVASGFALYHRGGLRGGTTPAESDQPQSSDPQPQSEAGEHDTQPDAIPDEELLTDEDRVVQLLEDQGGRMKQVDIVEETGWSKSKVSMLLSDMEEEETITKIRVGRENIVALAGHEPEAAGSPFDDE